MRRRRRRRRKALFGANLQSNVCRTFRFGGIVKWTPSSILLCWCVAHCAFECEGGAAPQATFYFHQQVQSFAEKVVRRPAVSLIIVRTARRWVEHCLTVREKDCHGLGILGIDTTFPWTSRWSGPRVPGTGPMFSVLSAYHHSNWIVSHQAVDTS